VKRTQTDSPAILSDSVFRSNSKDARDFVVLNSTLSRYFLNASIGTWLRCKIRNLHGPENAPYFGCFQGAKI
jgi:hypothetical protein